MIDPEILKTWSDPEAVTESGSARRDRAPPAFRFRDTGALLSDALKAWYRHNAPRLGASLAFYTMFSLAPLLIVVIGVASLIFGRAAAEGQIIGQIRELTGREGAEVIRQVVEGAREPVSGIVATTVGLLTLFLGATAVVAELRDALNTIWEVPAQEGQWGRGIIKILKERILSFVMVLGFGFLLLVSLIGSAALAFAGLFFRHVLPMPELALQSLTFVVSFVVTAGLIAVIYKVMPEVDLRWRDVAAGAVLTSLLFSLGKLLIGLYLVKTSLGSAYGAAGSLVVLLVWVYFSAQIFLFGAEFTRVFARRFNGGRSGSPAVSGPFD